MKAYLLKVTYSISVRKLLYLGGVKHSGCRVRVRCKGFG